MTKKIPAFLVISRYNENVDWLKEYTPLDALIINKGEQPFHPYSYDNNIEVIPALNLGGNQRDICWFAYTHYEYLPKLIAFIQAYPFDHCKKEIFDERIYQKTFTKLEYYGIIPSNNFERRTTDGGFAEINNSWYIDAHNKSKNQTCSFHSFDHFMYTYFSDYNHLDVVVFSPGSQYIVEKEQILQYPRVFWKELMEMLNTKSPTEGHIIERALFYIFAGTYKLRETK